MENIYSDDYAMKTIEKVFTINNIEKIDSKKFQKLKYDIINELVNELFKFKNSKEYYQIISNLIVISLTSAEKTPVDIYFPEKKNDRRKNDNSFKRILLEEFNEGIKDIKRRIKIENQFKECLKRFLKTYDLVNHIEYTPYLKKKVNNNKNYFK
ncbi:MAG: hypothetical protein ACP6IY_04245 [Promethearchaeia archaeon]